MKALAVGFVSFTVVFAATLALLGLPEDGDAVDAIALAEEEERLAALGARPNWLEGHAWLVSINGADPCWLVVARADSEGYRQGLSCEGDRKLAADLVIGGATYAGNFTRDLSRASGEGVTRFFEWPLRDGAEWTTMLSGEEVVVSAAFSPAVQGPAGPEPGFELSMFRDGEPFLHYDYAPSIGWWSTLYSEGGWALRVLDFDRDWRGVATVADASLVFSKTWTATSMLPQFPTFESENNDALVLTLLLAGTGTARTEVRDPTGQLRYQNDGTVVRGVNSRYAFIDSAPDGAWTLGGPHVISEGSIAARIYGVRFDLVRL